jgi:hypothetical protein
MKRIFYTVCILANLVKTELGRLELGVIETDYGLDGRGSILGKGKKDFSLFHSVRTGSGVHPASYSMGAGGYFLGGKAAGA